VNDQLDAPLRNKVLDLIRENDGRLGWHGIARMLGADELAEQAEVFMELRALEKLGILRRETSDGAIRFWIVKKPEQK